MKLKLLSFAVAAGLVFSAAYKPGTCTAEVQGIGGPVPVTVEFTADAIKSVKVGANKETQGVDRDRAASGRDR